ncbi:M48 family metallopeptidase [Acidobacteriota bacterium]
MEKIHPLLNQEKQSMAKRYEKENRILSLAGAIISFLTLLAFYYSGLSAKLASPSISESIIKTFLFYAVAFQAVLAIFGTPLHFYSSYIHEHKWNFSNHTVKSWFLEQLKSFLVSLMIFLIVLSLLFRIMAVYPQNWWLIAGLAMALVSIVFSTLLPVVILPVFNKYTRIENKELTSVLEKTLSKAGLRSSGFFKEDMSRQTKKENAFFVGLGKTRRVVLGDNLMEKMSVPEIESIIAHEVGHYKHKHIWKLIGLGTLQQLIIFYVLNMLMKMLFPQFLQSTRWNLTLFPFFVILLGAISGFFFKPLGNTLSRKFEKQADSYALESIKHKTEFMTALAGLADRNLSNAYPDWWVKLLYYSHPPIGERLSKAEQFQ